MPSSYDITSESVLSVLESWRSRKDLVQIFKLKSMTDVKYLNQILKKLYLTKKVKMGKTKDNTTVWKIKEA